MNEDDDSSALENLWDAGGELVDAAGGYLSGAGHVLAGAGEAIMGDNEAADEQFKEAGPGFDSMEQHWETATDLIEDAFN